jgi:acyl carrier protein
MSTSETRLQYLTPRERLLGLVRKVLGQAAMNRPLPIDARLSELGVSSIKMVSLMLAIETEFDLTIPQSAITPENFASLATVELLITRIGGAALPADCTAAADRSTVRAGDRDDSLTSAPSSPGERSV